MPKIVENEEYLNTEESMAELGATRQRFYTNAKPLLKAYHFDARKMSWYRKREVLALKTGNLMRADSIVISGIFGNWTEHVRSLGYQVDTKNREIEIVTTPADAPATFGIPTGKHFVKRSRITFISGTPICVWASYYPLEFVNGDIHQEMKRNEDLDVVKAIKEQHGVAVGWSKERYMARLATTEEQEILQLLRDDPVLVLQRASRTSDKETLVLYSSMTLLGTWFAPEREYEVHNWDE